MAKNIIGVNLEDHGYFESTCASVEKATKLGKAKLASRIAEQYEGRKYNKTYWSKYPTSTLAVVYAGIYSPTR